MGRRIRSLRSEAGLSVTGLAELSGVGRCVLTQTEPGQADRSWTVVRSDPRGSHWHRTRPERCWTGRVTAFLPRPATRNACTLRDGWAVPPRP
ncbi:helix-turn-helix domain-containing protein [Nocardiopsis dassonvillei]|uniref:helix-turn-helix domain-containing protein n=1 Tax=Nocardiopsis dassonvillei TaxID=2014 RepID=UPI00200C960F|nr:helix-turn-helix transcriptional regulator [Nocardiopsis dassonvillei]MCK9868575.1 helix-turn-helix domain-containing protein [Nocardiopsis dassonvillei]